jgi:two-component system, OmpR family, KDP operon response regulator KdpE
MPDAMSTSRQVPTGGAPTPVNGRPTPGVSTRPSPWPADARVRVLVADGDPARVGTMVHVLGEAGMEAVTAYRGATALARMADEIPDVVIVGDGLGDGPTVELIPRLLGRARLPILALATHPDDLHVVALLDAGADDVINAAFRPPELLARLRALLRRAGGTSTTQPGGPLPDGLQVDAGRREASIRDQTVQLTPTEFELLVLIALRRGDVVDHRTLLRAVWPGRPDADPDLLRTHLTHLNAKLIGAGHPGLRNVRSTGYALRVSGADSFR